MVEIDGFPEYFVDKNGIIYSKKCGDVTSPGQLELLNLLSIEKDISLYRFETVMAKRKIFMFH